MMNIRQIVKLAGGPGVVGAACGITSQAVSQWEKVPADHVLTVEELVGGAVTRQDMCPKVFGNPETGQTDHVV